MSSLPGVRALACALLVLLAALGGLRSHARAQQPYEEPADVTRLDVERLPPEAIEITRDLYARGFYLQAIAGGRGYAFGLGRYANPGPWLSIETGYELSTWLRIAGGVELSLHGTDAPAPPSAPTFERIDAVLSPRVQLALSARSALWLGPEIALYSVSSDALRVLGIEGVDELGVAYGGSLGFDWHLRSRHHSLGLLAGARMAPALRGPDGEGTLSVHTAAYLKYVF